MNQPTPCREEIHQVDICVVGGGLAGMLAAIAAARHGATVALIHDRPVLGGNCSSEIRMWALGCHGDNNRETGIFEEILCENMYRNPERNYSIWDTVLYEKVRFEPNIDLMLNCSCTDLTMDGSRIRSVRAWQLTTYTWHTVTADIFIDCSGDSILAPLSGALYRMGREAASEYGEDIAPEIADSKTMGLTCLIHAKETEAPVEFIPPAWANIYETDEELNYRPHNLTARGNFWWLELGGEDDSIHDTERLRDELLKLAFGVWDHIKNRGDHGADNWTLDWVGFLPGKRESRRYIGDHVLTQNDVRAEGRFEDLIAYGGWSMDDHNPAGFRFPGEPTIYHSAPAPYGIPYRCLYSRNIDNLMFAGRNISATHSAMSSSRVMATCAILGQAAGTAAVIAIREKLTPRGVYEQKIPQLRAALMEDDCYLPFSTRRISAASLLGTLSAELGDPHVLINGLDRPIGGADNGYFAQPGEAITYRFENAQQIDGVRIIFDSDLNRTSCDGEPSTRDKPMLCNRPLGTERYGFPKTMVRHFRIDVAQEDGSWHTTYEDRDNHQRLVRCDIHKAVRGVRLVPLSTWGAELCHLFSFEVY